MVHFSVAGVLARSVAVFSSPFGKRTSTVAQAEEGIATIARDLNNIEAAVSAFPSTGGSLSDALIIQTVAMHLNFTVNKGTIDVKTFDATTISEADSNSILHSIEALLPVITSILDKIVAKRPAFQSIPFSSALIRSNLLTMNADTTALADALIAISPAADTKAAGMNLKATFDAKFTTAVAAFS